jgi:hypothetical protein
MKGLKRIIFIHHDENKRRFKQTGYNGVDPKPTKT